ncbi:MAG: beta-propeller fold lactonase family protein [Acidobacteria bacterium]|nr:beta-propeller fold lactonase family protein [Acidobacteriota bacterium]
MAEVTLSANQPHDRDKRRKPAAIFSIAIVTLAIALTGCGQFFIPPTGGGGTTGSNRVYVANSATNSLSGFTIGTAALSAVSGSPLSLGYVPIAAAVTPNNNFIYVAGPGAIYMYTISSDGSLSAPSSGAAVAAVNVVSLDVSPDGQWLFGLDNTQTVLDQFQINSSTGALSVVAATPYSASTGTVVPKQVKVSPTGNLVFIALGTAGDIVFTLNTSTGAVVNSQYLKPADTTSDNALAINSTGAYLYIARSGTNGGLGVYTIGAGGVLNSIAGSPFAAGNQPSSVVIDSTGKYVYVANRGDSNISGYSIGTGSSLTALSGSPYASGTGVTSLGVDKSGKYLLAGANGGSPDLSMYSYDATTLGKLNLATSTTSGTQPAGVIAIALTH